MHGTFSLSYVKHVGFYLGHSLIDLESCISRQTFE